MPGMTAAKMQGYAYVGDKRVAEAIVSCQLIDSSRGKGRLANSGSGRCENSGRRDCASSALAAFECRQFQ